MSLVIRAYTYMYITTISGEKGHAFERENICENLEGRKGKEK